MADPRCRVCAHPERSLIDQDIASGSMSNRAVSAKWGMSYDSVRRHKRDHLSAALRAALTAREAAWETAGAVKAIDRMEDLYSRAQAILDAATSEGKTGIAMNAIRELRGIVELLAKLTGELDERPQVQVLNVAASPEWAETRARLLGALAPFPEARRAVALALTDGGGDA